MNNLEMRKKNFGVKSSISKKKQQEKLKSQRKIIKEEKKRDIEARKRLEQENLINGEKSIFKQTVTNLSMIVPMDYSEYGMDAENKIVDWQKITFTRAMNERARMLLATRSIGEIKLMLDDDIRRNRCLSLDGILMTRIMACMQMNNAGNQAFQVLFDRILGKPQQDVQVTTVNEENKTFEEKLKDISPEAIRAMSDIIEAEYEESSDQ
jgi:hypothetical protein